MRIALNLPCLAIFSLVSLGWGAPLAAQGFSGPGGTIPQSGTGGGGNYPFALPPTASSFVSTIQVPIAVNRVDLVRIDNWQHTWVGDLHIVLVDPVGKGHNVMVRPGFNSAGPFGNSGERLGGNYTFVESGGLQVPHTPSTDMPAGTYTQDFGDPGTTIPWPSGLHNTFHTPLGSISGPAGAWKLVIVDWEGGDSGFAGGVTIEVNGVPPPPPPPPPPVAYCTAKINSLGCAPVISATGQASASASSGFYLNCARVLNRKPGVLFYSLTGRSAVPFQGSFLCIASPLLRGIPAQSGGNAMPANDCTGVYSMDFNAFAAGALGGNPHAALRVIGTVVTSQWYGRDPGLPVPHATALSSAIEFTLGH